MPSLIDSRPTVASSAASGTGCIIFMEPNHIIKVFFEDSKDPLDLNEDIVNMSELLKELSVFTNEPVLIG